MWPACADWMKNLTCILYFEFNEKWKDMSTDEPPQALSPLKTEVKSIFQRRKVSVTKNSIGT